MYKQPYEKYPPKILGKHLGSFCFYKHGENDTQIRHMMPLGTVQIIFHLGNGLFHHTQFTNKWEKRPEVFIGGPFNASYFLKPEIGTEIFAIMMKPGMSRYFFSMPISELKNQLILPRDIWGEDGKLIGEKIRIAKNNAERVTLAEEFLLKQIRPINNSPLEKAVQTLLKNNGLIKLTKLLETTGFSTSHFRKKFKEEIGLSPKEFQKIIRINALAKYYRNNSNTSLTDLGYQFGYFDQSHFIKDFKTVTGVPPRQFLGDQRFLQLQ